MNTPTGNTVSTAEHTFALLLGLSRNISPAHQSLIEGRWDRKSYMGNQLAGKTLGIVGLGRIGQEVASRARAFEMRVLGFDPFLSDENATKLGIEPSSTVREMLPRIDYLTVHTPLTKETKGLIGFDELEIIKPGARLINCARGGIYDEDALAQGLKSGRLAGVALDVFQSEPCTDSPLFGMPGVLCTPHLGASTEEAQTQVAVEAVELLVGYLCKGEIRHAVNTTAVDRQTLDAIRGHLDVAYRLGLFLSQWTTGQIIGCKMDYRGDASSKDTKLLTASFCAGLMQHAMEDEVNIVNAELLLRERGIKLSEECQTATGAFSSSISAELETSQDRYRASGTLFGNNMPRLIRLNNYRLEAYLDGVLMVFMHQDVPGIIGSVGTTFGSHDVNIAQMAVGRDQPGGKAIGVLNLDVLPTDAAIESVRTQKGIDTCTIIQLPPASELPTWLQ